MAESNEAMLIDVDDWGGGIYIGTASFANEKQSGRVINRDGEYGALLILNQPFKCTFERPTHKRFHNPLAMVMSWDVSLFDDRGGRNFQHLAYGCDNIRSDGSNVRFDAWIGYSDNRDVADDAILVSMQVMLMFRIVDN